MDGITVWASARLTRDVDAKPRRRSRHSGWQSAKRKQVSAIFGSAEVDLRGATIDGDEAAIEATALFGSLRLRVPDDWAVDVQTTNLFGNFETKRAQPSDPKARLTILASSTFGSIELTS